MQTLRNKLSSKQGSSLFLAIIFFMLCFFVGGTVLAASTSNAGRIASMKASRQDYYTQRSAAIFVQDQFAEPGRLVIKLTTDTKLEVSPGTSGGYVPVESVTRMSSVEAVGDQTALQQLVGLAVARQFYNKNNDALNLEEAGVTGRSFIGFNAIGSDQTTVQSYFNGLGDFESGEVQFDGAGQFSAVYQSDYANDSDFGDLHIKIQTEGTEDLFAISVPASVTVTESLSGSTNVGAGSATMTRIETKTVTVIWGKASIQKGGAA